MKSTNEVRSQFSRAFISLVLFAWMLVPSGATGQTFDIADYWPMPPGAWWHYSGGGLPGVSAEDGFAWIVLPNTVMIHEEEVSMILTRTDEGDDARQNDVDFWSIDETGNLYLHGFYKGSRIPYMPVQGVILSNKALVGQKGMVPGSTIADSVSATVRIDFPVVGEIPISGTIFYEITYEGPLEAFRTRMGPVTDVLQVGVKLMVGVSNPFGEDFTVPFHESTLYLAKNVGMIAHDQNIDLNDAEAQVIDGAGGLSMD